MNLKIIKKLRQGENKTIKYQSNIKHYTNKYTIE